MLSFVFKVSPVGLKLTSALFLFSCSDPMDFQHCLFEKPVRIEPNRDYSILARIAGASRSNSGSGGLTTVSVEEE